MEMPLKIYEGVGDGSAKSGALEGGSRARSTLGSAYPQLVMSDKISRNHMSRGVTSMANPIFSSKHERTLSLVKSTKATNLTSLTLKREEEDQAVNNMS